MESYQTRLNDRRIQFAQKTVEKLPGIEEALDRLTARADDMELLFLANKFFHQLAGAGGIYEMADLCDTTIAAEEICSRAIADNRPVSAEELQTLRRKCSEIADICAAATNAHGR